MNKTTQNDWAVTFVTVPEKKETFIVLSKKDEKGIIEFRNLNSDDAKKIKKHVEKRPPMLPEVAESEGIKIQRFLAYDSYHYRKCLSGFEL